MQWAPRDLNEEADALANLDFKGFTPELRIPVDLAKVEYQGLREFLRDGKRVLRGGGIRAAGRQIWECGGACSPRPGRQSFGQRPRQADLAPRKRSLVETRVQQGPSP